MGVAYYARRGGAWAQAYTLLHPPYTAWHLAYVVIGAALAPQLDVVRLVGSLLAFFLAVGVAAHALDELHGRPLRTTFSGSALTAVAAAALLGAAGIGVAAVPVVGIVVMPVALVGLALVVAYNLELFGGRLHTPWGFAIAWGAYPVVVGCLAQSGRVTFPAIVAAIAAVALSLAQRTLSTPARLLRRRVHAVDARLMVTGGAIELTGADLLRPLERALRALSWGICLLAAGAALAHWR